MFGTPFFEGSETRWNEYETHMIWTILVAAFVIFVFYSWWIEPAWRLRVQEWAIKSDTWTGPPLTIAIIADLHAGWPHIPLKQIRKIVARTNREGADLIVNLGDLGAAHPFAVHYGKRTIADCLASLHAPLGVYHVLGNHDWWQDQAALEARGVPEAARALVEAKLSLLDNEAVEVPWGNGAFWVAGLGDQRPKANDPSVAGFDDIDAALADVPKDAPVILLAHEPDLFPNVPENVVLTLSGHTHGGQVRFGPWSPFIAFSGTEEFGYGPFEADGRHLVVSGGIGCAVVPARFGIPPEITVVTLSGPDKD
ncbi:MAG: metallophosphoesterase [Pseudomonadota bacterium]